MRTFETKGTVGDEVTQLKRRILAVDAALVLVPTRILSLKLQEVCSSYLCSHFVSSRGDSSVRIAALSSGGQYQSGVWANETAP